MSAFDEENKKIKKALVKKAKTMARRDSRVLHLNAAIFKRLRLANGHSDIDRGSNRPNFGPPYSGCTCILDIKPDYYRGRYRFFQCQPLG